MKIDKWYWNEFKFALFVILCIAALFVFGELSSHNKVQSDPDVISGQCDAYGCW